MLQCVLQCVCVLVSMFLCVSVFKSVAVRCSVLQCVAVCYSVLQCVAAFQTQALNKLFQEKRVLYLKRLHFSFSVYSHEFVSKYMPFVVNTVALNRVRSTGFR